MGKFSGCRKTPFDKKRAQQAAQTKDLQKNKFQNKKIKLS